MSREEILKLKSAAEKVPIHPVRVCKIYGFKCIRVDGDLIAFLKAAKPKLRSLATGVLEEFYQITFHKLYFECFRVATNC